MHRFRPLATTLPLLLAMLAGPATLSAQQPQMPPPPVSVLELRAQPLPVVNELPGRVSATRTAEVRPRVSGIVLERVFEQGSFVQEGSMLYRIDPSQYAVAMASAEATLSPGRKATGRPCHSIIVPMMPSGPRSGCRSVPARAR